MFFLMIRPLRARSYTRSKMVLQREVSEAPNRRSGCEEDHTMPDQTWTTDEYGNRTWTFQDWTIRVFHKSGVDCDGPDGADLTWDEDRDAFIVGHDAPYDGPVAVWVPIPVLMEFLKAVKGDSP